MVLTAKWITLYLTMIDEKRGCAAGPQRRMDALSLHIRRRQIRRLGYIPGRTLAAKGQFMRLLFSAALCLWFAAAHAGEIEGQAKPVDGDSFNMEIRLFGIDAAEASQTCKDAKGQDYPCGQIASDALSGFLKDETVRCEIQTQDRRYDRPVAICYADGVDIGAALVDQGLAVA
ncbi:MAG: thermonuclease family protein, partial [Methyloceanibacter sp.]|nr:thermonuclease family protein [Methyloceanibacter sp.]